MKAGNYFTIQTTKAELTATEISFLPKATNTGKEGSDGAKYD